MENSAKKSDASHREQRTTVDAENVMNLALMDPPRWGWAAVGAVVDLLPPQQRSQRRSTAVLHRKLRRRKATSIAMSAKSNERQSIPPKAGTHKTVTPAPKSQNQSNPVKSVSGEVPDGVSQASQTPSAQVSLQPLHKTEASETVHTGTSKPVAGPPTSINALDKEVTDTEQVKQNPQTTTTSSSLSKPPENHNENATPPIEKTQPNSLAEAKADEKGKALHNNETIQSSGAPTKAKPTAAKKPLQPPAPASLDTSRILGYRPDMTGIHVTKKAESERKEGKPEVLECRVKPIDDNGVLDMYAYHRGREGFEPRNPGTSELLMPLEPTDTNDDVDAPRPTVQVKIEFPLGDEDPESEKAMYREIVPWDLSNPEFPSPMLFASNLATEFGLDYAQTLDLGLSIQQQIEAFVRQNHNYCTPISVKDPYGNERRYTGSAVITHRYGQVLQIAPGGTRVLQKERQRVQPASSHQSSMGSVSSGRRKSVDRKQTERKIERQLLPVDYSEDLVEERFCMEVRRRSAIESKDAIAKLSGGETSILERKLNAHCHICHKRCTTTYTFNCGIQSHAYCELHCKARLGPEFNKERPIFLSCPVCSLVCTCSKCRRKVGVVARALKRESERQGVPLEKVVFEDVLTRCKEASAVRPASRPPPSAKRSQEIDETDEDIVPPKSGANATKARKSNDGKHPRQELVRELLVPKPPISEFPREIHGTLEREPGSLDDYLKVYTWKGAILTDEFPKVWQDEKNDIGDAEESAPSSNGELVEDGNVDYCQICRNHGNLLCCDVCPRAFHIDCIQRKDEDISEDRWECPVCEKEKAPMSDDLVDGKQSLDLICSSFVEVDASTEDGLKSLHILSTVHEMLKRLLDYDFGYMFAEPVDAEAIPGYCEIVKEPMDLGTICSKLTKSQYAKIIKKGGSFQDVLTTVLKDIELVWHNCFSFNFEGSAIYRMASVQKKRATFMQLKNFDGMLSPEVKTAVSEYVAACAKKRSKFGPGSKFDAGITEKEKMLRASRPKGKHKITVKAGNSGVNRAAAILDPVSGRIVKIYSSMKSAGQAAHSMISYGHRCEWPATQDLVKQVVLRSGSDPSVLLFGYRWVMLDDLRAGKVVFEEPKSKCVELFYQGLHYVFASVDEALSFPKLPKSTQISNIREELDSLQEGGGWKGLWGMQWRRPPAIFPSGKSTSETPSDDENALVVTSISDDFMFPNEKNIFRHSAIIKKDVVLGKKLLGFDSIESAFADWQETASASPSFPLLEERTLKNFQEYYLDGDRTIDGLVYQSQKPQPRDPAEQPNMNGVSISSTNLAPQESMANGSKTEVQAMTSLQNGETNKRKRNETGCEVMKKIRLDETPTNTEGMVDPARLGAISSSRTNEMKGNGACNPTQ